MSKVRKKQSWTKVDASREGHSIADICTVQCRVGKRNRIGKTELEKLPKLENCRVGKNNCIPLQIPISRAGHSIAELCTVQCRVGKGTRFGEKN